MLPFIYLLIVFCNPIKIQGQDLEIEGVMHVGDSFLHQLQRNLRVNFRSQNKESSTEDNDDISKSRNTVESTEKKESNKRKTKNPDKDLAPKSLRFVVDDSKEHVDRDNEDNDIKPVDKKDEYAGEQFEKFLDTDKPDDDIKKDKQITHLADANAIKSSDESKGHPKIFNKYLLINSDTKNESMRAKENKGNKKIESNKNEAEKEEIIIQIIDDTQNQSKNKNRASSNKDTKVAVTRSSKYKKHYASKIHKTNPLLNKDHPIVKRFLKHVIYDEFENIERIARRIEEKIPLNKSDEEVLLKTSRTSYITKMEGYVNYINKQNPISNVDKEYLYLDIVASSNMLIYSESRKLLNTMIDKSRNNISMYDLETLTQAIYEEHINHKKRAIFFICQELNICRSYPGFSDYLAELISEILKLSDTRLGHVVKVTGNLIKKRDHFFKAFMKDNVADMIGERLAMMSKDMFNFREMFSIIRSIIMHRFKLMKTSDDQLKIRTKAVRLLIDIVDKTFSLAAGNDLTAMTFDTTVNGVRQWALGKRDEVETPLKLLFEHIVAVIHINWNKFVTQEVSMLTEVIMTGETDMTVIFDELFANGSPFVRYDFVETD